MPILDLSSCICGGEYVTSLKIFIFRSPTDIGKGIFRALRRRNRGNDTFLLDIKNQYFAISSS